MHVHPSLNTLENDYISYENVSFWYSREINIALKAPSPVYEVDQELEGGQLSLSASLGVWNRPPRKKKISNPRGHARGSMVTGQIEPKIILDCQAVKGFFGSS